MRRSRPDSAVPDDNRNRAAADVRSTLSKNGGSLAESGHGLKFLSVRGGSSLKVLISIHCWPKRSLKILRHGDTYVVTTALE